ncbi:hypothetical protein CDL12_07004 [Handroanthus impetiginosus]|uniref:Uncharacterized protein n=1 Tax=Handroanthus impetiginosus TaxID=429701 RepID=A0A2G9HS30_9LAMI|nr:hypothetical protein CDL12_07004 [Handroanthus impetiginosus]
MKIKMKPLFSYNQSRFFSLKRKRIINYNNSMEMRNIICKAQSLFKTFKILLGFLRENREIFRFLEWIMRL